MSTQIRNTTNVIYDLILLNNANCCYRLEKNEELTLTCLKDILFV